ncbi:MAG: hypothetical protein IPM55_15405 [Acidobacteria bacterium]|nr:hypothetical protein [Acidobacteriota bacterium]
MTLKKLRICWTVSLLLLIGGLVNVNAQNWTVGGGSITNDRYAKGEKIINADNVKVWY